jgi:disulfide bond formation protein DsbB
VAGVDEGRTGTIVSMASGIVRRLPGGAQRVRARGLAAWAGVLALLVQALLPLGDALYHAHHGGVPGHAGDADAALVANAAGSSGHQAPDDDGADPCKGMQFLGPALLPVLALALLALVVFCAFAPVWQTRKFVESRIRFARARAPPVLV